MAPTRTWLLICVLIAIAWSTSTLWSTRPAGDQAHGRHEFPDMPPYADWHLHPSTVTLVRDQDPLRIKCGSCWAFAVAGAMEGVNGIDPKGVFNDDPQI